MAPRSRSSGVSGLGGGPGQNGGTSNSTPASTRTRRSTRNTVGKNLAPSTVYGDDASASPSDFPFPSTPSEYTRTITAQDSKGRDSLSSVSASLDNYESSGYSTPATSAAATPMMPPKSIVPGSTIHNTRRGPSRRITTVNPELSLVARAAALRNSKYSLNSKRKRVSDSEDEDADEDNTPDARLAQALQEQEDAAANNMTGMAVTSSASNSRFTSRRTSRKVQKIIPKPEPTSNLSGDKLNMGGLSSSKNVKVVLSPHGSNAVNFGSTNNSKIITETDDSDDSTEPLDCEDSEDSDFEDSDTLRAMNNSRISRNKPSKVVSKAYVSGSSSRRSGYKLPQRPAILPSHTRRPPGQTYGTSTDLESTTSSDSDSSLSDSSVANRRINLIEDRRGRRGRMERARLEAHHPDLNTMWTDLESLPKISSLAMEQPTNITRELKPFQLEGVAWMKAMEQTSWGGGLLGDEMGMGKTIQAVSLIMSDFPAPQPSLVLIPPVALMQWQQEIASYTDGTLKTFVYHGTNAQTKGVTAKDLQKYNVILMSYNSLESMYRKQEKGFKRKNGVHKEKSIIHQIRFHRVILDEAHNIKQRTTGSAKACFALKADHKWCLSGTPLQNRIGEFFSLIRFLDIRPFACYFCKQCSCSCLNWVMDANNRCTGCSHSGMQHVSVFNQELLNPIQKFGNKGPGKEAFRKLRILTDRFMLRRVKRDHSSAMELPSKEIYVNREFFGEEENDFAGSIMNSGTRKFETYVAQGVLLNNYANIFGLIMQMRQVADHPDLILKKNSQGGQNVLVCCICDETAEEAIRSSCRHDFCRECVKNYLRASENPDCPHCHIPLSIDLEQPEVEQDEQQVKKSSIINRIKMENWTSSSKIEALVHDLWQLRSNKKSHKSIIFSQFTTMLQLIEWRLRRAGITTVMLDGSMTPAQRQASINHFMTNANVECFLVSLKAGGVALNLTEASHVFIVDPWWNPAAEWQSADRCHRIGQARPCSITRLCIEDSVESRMVLLQEKKANMINSTINADESAMESLTPEDMQFLFRGT